MEPVTSACKAGSSIPTRLLDSEGTTQSQKSDWGGKNLITGEPQQVGDMFVVGEKLGKARRQNPQGNKLSPDSLGSATEGGIWCQEWE